MRTVFAGTGLAVAVALVAAARADDGESPLTAEAGHSYQIENAAHAGQLLRPRDASNKDGTPLVLYPKVAWRCVTWRLDAVPSAAASRPADGPVHLYNRFTHKTLVPDPAAAADAATTPVVERAITPELDAAERWRFVPVGDGLYRVEQVATGRALAADADGTVVVTQYTGDAAQKWRLLPEPAKFTG